MDYYSAKQTANRYFEAHPLRVPDQITDTSAYSLVMEDNLALALYERCKALDGGAGAQTDAGVEAAKEIGLLASDLPQPTAIQLMEARAQIDQMAATLAEDEEADRLVGSSKS